MLLIKAHDFDAGNDDNEKEEYDFQGMG